MNERAMIRPTQSYSGLVNTSSVLVLALGAVTKLKLSDATPVLRDQ